MNKDRDCSFYEKMSAEEKFEALFRQHYASLCKRVYGLLRDKSLSEDLVQEIFIKIWEKKTELRFDDRFFFYLKKSCYHAALNYLSGKNYTLETEPPMALTNGEGSDDRLLLSELEQSIRAAINQLPEKTRLIFTFSRYGEMTYKEIAGQLHISVKAVEKHMGKALRQLKDHLKDHLMSIFL